MSIQSTTPAPPRVPNPPLQEDIKSPQWIKWFSSIGTVLSEGQTDYEGDLDPGGSYRTLQMGRAALLNATVPSGSYSATIVNGVPVVPSVDVVLTASKGIQAILRTNGDLELSGTSASDILISGSYIASDSQENV